MSYNWHGWMAETDNDNADDREGVWYLTIVDPDGEEYAVIMHRVCDGKYPLDGELAQSKIARAENIVAALNAVEESDPHHETTDAPATDDDVVWLGGQSLDSLPGYWLVTDAAGKALSLPFLTEQDAEDEAEAMREPGDTEDAIAVAYVNNA